jgi:thioesterase domain-containing protein
MRFHIATEGGWDAGCFSACLIAAALAASGVSLARVILVALPPLAIASVLLRRYYANFRTPLPGGAHAQDA